MKGSTLVALGFFTLAVLFAAGGWHYGREQAEKRRIFIEWCEAHGGVPIYPVQSIDCRFPPKD